MTADTGQTSRPRAESADVTERTDARPVLTVSDARRAEPSDASGDALSPASRPSSWADAFPALVPYYTVLIPYAGPYASDWHPTEPTGPFKVLSRGAFKRIEDAHRWALDHLCGFPYTVRRIEPLPLLESR